MEKLETHFRLGHDITSSLKLFFHHQAGKSPSPSHRPIPSFNVSQVPLMVDPLLPDVLVMFIRSLPNLRRREWLRWFGETTNHWGKDTAGNSSFI
jgi:hypothetical protein